MKALYCTDCHDLVVPDPEAERIKLCACETHAVWLAYAGSGAVRFGQPTEIRVCNVFASAGGKPIRERCWVVQIADAFLSSTELDAEQILSLITSGQLVSRCRPGEGRHSAYAPIPPAVELGPPLSMDREKIIEAGHAIQDQAVEACGKHGGHIGDVIAVLMSLLSNLAGRRAVEAGRNYKRDARLLGDMLTTNMRRHEKPLRADLKRRAN